ncbi:MAG: hypothetical protein D6722_14225 [Bacteroidetes bacterium]|nr:MAG: hypothetical protein D6722_14225 [Bacteroidota bacterium]
MNTKILSFPGLRALLIGSLLLLLGGKLVAQSAAPPAPGPSLSAASLSMAQQDALVSGAAPKLRTFFDYQEALTQDSLAPAFRQALAEGIRRLFISDSIAIGPYPSLRAFLDALEAGDSALLSPQSPVETHWEPGRNEGSLSWSTAAGRGEATFLLHRQEKQFGPGREAVWEVKLGQISLQR